jgi:hypothetical protein
MANCKMNACHMTAHGASASANACFRAYSANSIAVILGAILVASIIICALRLSLGLVGLVLLAVVLLVQVHVNTPRKRTTA